jgi:acetyltransferase
MATRRGGCVVTYTIGRYPVHLIDVVHVAGGSRVTMRPTLPQDVELQRAFFRALSPQSRYSRFMTGLRELPDVLAERFTNIDYRRHLALLAEVFSAAGEQTMIGEGRYVVNENDLTSCEFAVAVADDWQNCGIGRALLARLERQAAASGIRTMGAETLVANTGMQALAARAGYAIARGEDAQMVRLQKVLASADAAQSARPFAA